MDEKAIVKIGAHGEAMKCAKGLDTGCGYKAGAKICGKCGAMAVEVKADDTAKPTAPDADTPEADTPEAEVDPEIAAEADALDDTVAELEAMLKKARAAARARRLESMGAKTAADEVVYVCGLSRKVHGAADQVCADCPGGCAPEGTLPTLLEIEGIAEEAFGGKVLDSGYVDEFDTFVVDIEGKDGRPVEAFFHGSTGECFRWQLLDVDLGVKTAEGGAKVISFDDAAALALGHVEGKVARIDAEVVDGYDAYAVEIDGVDGKSHDVYIALDGTLLDHHAFTAEESAAIEAEAAELNLKRAYADDARSAMAERGEAMDDGSFPIKDEADLRNAIMAHGRAKDPEAAKAHIITRAEALDLTDMLPEGWVAAKGDDDAVDEADGTEGMGTMPEEKSADADVLVAKVDVDADLTSVPIADEAPSDVVADEPGSAPTDANAAEPVDAMVDDPEILAGLIELEMLALEADVNGLLD